MTAQDETYNKIKKDILSADLTKSFGIKNPTENQITASLDSLLEKYSISHLDKNPKIVISKLIELYPDLKNRNIEENNSSGLSFLQKAILLLVVSFVGYHLFNGQLFKSDEAKAQEAQQEKIRIIEETKKRTEEKKDDLLNQLASIDKKDTDKNLSLYPKLLSVFPDNPEYQTELTKYQQEKTKAILTKLKKVKSTELDENIELYETLVKLNTDNSKYQDKVNYYTKKKKEKEKAYALKKERYLKNKQLKQQGLMWNYQESEDKMSSKKIKSAFVLSVNKFDFSFPYAGSQRATLLLRKHPKHGSDVILSIEKGQFICNSYNGCNVAVRFDKNKTKTYKALEPSDNSSTSIFIRNYKSFVSKLKKSKTVYIEAEFYQQGSVVMEFNTKDLSF